MTPYKLLFFLIILSSLVYKSTAISCYYCSSNNNSACLDPMQFDDETRARLIPIVNCEAAVPRVEDLQFFCRKIVQTIFHHKHESELRVTRGCGWVRHERPCYRADSRDHMETACQCFNDYCNSADSVNTALTAWFVALAACLYFYR